MIDQSFETAVETLKGPHGGTMALMLFIGCAAGWMLFMIFVHKPHIRRLESEMSGMKKEIAALKERMIPYDRYAEKMLESAANGRVLGERR